MLSTVLRRFPLAFQFLSYSDALLILLLSHCFLYYLAFVLPQCTVSCLYVLMVDMHLQYVLSNLFHSYLQN